MFNPVGALEVITKGNDVANRAPPCSTLSPASLASEIFEVASNPRTTRSGSLIQPSVEVSRSQRGRIARAQRIKLQSAFQRDTLVRINLGILRGVQGCSCCYIRSYVATNDEVIVSMRCRRCLPPNMRRKPAVVGAVAFFPPRVGGVGRCVDKLFSL